MSSFSNQLVNWYNVNHRKLPWRETKSPYKVWLSEIILQQTRVEQGLPYYEKFIANFPDVFSLAIANEEKILNLWQGLGYYSRARNLHYAAKQVVNDNNGKFPRTKPDLLKLKGVGDYTASAIASFCFEEPTPVIDGNVYRFICRFLGITSPIDIPDTRKEVSRFLENHITKVKASTFNQALMEFGALHCRPKNPNCQSCPFALDCLAFKKDLVEIIPSKSKTIKVKQRYFNYFLLLSKGELLLAKRTENDIWKNLFELPLIESEKNINQKEIDDLFRDYFNQNKSFEILFLSSYKHILSHQKIHASFWLVKAKGKINLKNTFATKFLDLHKYALPRLITRFMEDFENNGLQLQIL